MFVPLIIKQGHNIALLNTNELHIKIKELLIELNTYFSARGIDLFDELKNIDINSFFKLVFFWKNFLDITLRHN